MKPAAWKCEFVTACEGTDTMFVEQDPAGLRFNDAGEPSPFRVTPLYDCNLPLIVEALEIVHATPQTRGVYVLDEQDMRAVQAALRAARGDA